MAFDVRTAMLFGVLVTFLTAGLLSMSWRVFPAAVRPILRWWLAAMLLHAIGFLGLASQDVAPAWMSGVASFTLICLALSCIVASLRQFYGLRVRWLFVSVPATLVALAAVYFMYVVPNLQWQITTMSILLALPLAVAADTAFRCGGGGVVPRVTGTLFGLGALAMLARAGWEMLWPEMPNGVMDASALNLVCLSFLLLLPVLATIGFLLMCAERGQEELERTARMDYLTGIYNRRAMEDLAVRAISASRRHGAPLAIMTVDVDHFKLINDEHGHEAGDQALIETVDRLRSIMRAEDLLGRQGGEEFVALMPDIDLGHAQAAAERLRRSFADHPMRVSGSNGLVELQVTVSVGVAALEPRDGQFSHLLRRADRAMYAAKAAGRNRVMLDVGEP